MERAKRCFGFWFILTFSFFFFTALSLYSRENPKDLLTGLEKISIGISKFCKNENQNIYYSPKLEHGKARLLPESNPDLEPTNWYFQVRIASDGPWIDIYFDPGPSGDPRFFVVASGTRVPGLTPVEKASSGTQPIEKTDEQIGILADELIIPGDGYVYMHGNSNKYWDEFGKFKFENGGLLEVSQPFNWVGLDSKTTQPIILFEKPEEKGEEVGRLPQGEPITVVLEDFIDNDHFNFLIKTRFNLLGWLTISKGELPSCWPIGDEGASFPIEGIYYHGD